jgi:DNA ligase D-like protein (predicted 3'-phosphoesterase)
MSLTAYKKKRNFAKTKEPKPKVGKINKKLIYMIHEHHATRLHWDLRLEYKGVLLSWALPKTPLLKKGEKRLAVHVEDHPKDYARFAGRIPEGQYGAGLVKIWDSGWYEPEAIKPDKLIIHIHGKKLKGKYILIKTRFANDSWLFFKGKE